MNIIDVIIILIILSGAVIGYKSGFTKQLISFVGFIVVIILSYLLKNYVSELLYTYLPFFKFGGVLKGVSVLNIVLYEMIAFMIVFSLLMIVFKVVLFVSKVFETLLKFTIILGIPSKLLGAVVGTIEYSIIVFIGLYILTLPIFQIEGMDHSKFKDQILYKTPILSHYTKDGLKVFTKINTLKDKYEDSINANEFNLEALDLLLEYKVVTPKSVQKLLDSKKLEIDSVDSVLNKYDIENKGDE